MSASRFFAPLIWLHVPVIAGIAASNRVPAWHPALLMALAAAGATLAVWRWGAGIGARLVVAAALTMAPILMVYAGTGPWQVDWHMYFFVVFGMLVAYVDWRPIALAAGLTAVHHAVIDALFPAAVFPEADPARVILHAGIVVVDAIVLFWIVRKMGRLLGRIAKTKDDLEAGIAARTTRISELNTDLSNKVHELQSAFENLEREVQARKEDEARLDHLAHHDLLTGLPARPLLMDRLRVALATAERAGTDVLVVYLDLDGFKAINDRLGHGTGDEALALTGRRLAASLRGSDTASRVGGEEFVVITSAWNAVSEAAAMARRLLDTIGEPMLIDGESLALSAHIGMSLYPADGSNPEELIRKADLAMSRAKTENSSFHLYTPAIHAEMLATATLKRDLELALERDEFVVHYQPIISLTSREIIGAEALVRWLHPTRGLLGPQHFIRFAEDHGLIADIGTVVMDKACAQINRFALGPDDEFTMAVNVSAIQFNQTSFVDTVVEVLAANDVPRSRLEIEITESVVMDDAASVIRTLHELADLGIKLSIDDFGTGYSSLAYIKTFPVHTLKIDRSFVIDVADNQTDQAIAATIITLAHNLGMRTIAEGIESEEQLERLRELGADDMQGFLISKPLPAAEFERFVCNYGVLKLAA